MSTIFDQIVSGEMKSWKVWEDDEFLAFLTTFPNTPGFTVVIPKENAKDLEEIPDNVKQDLEIFPVRWIDEVLRLALQDPFESFEVVTAK